MMFYGEELYNDIIIRSSGIISNQSKPNSLNPTCFFLFSISKHRPLVWRVKEAYNDVTKWNFGIVTNQNKPNTLNTKHFLCSISKHTHHRTQYECRVEYVE